MEEIARISKSDRKAAHESYNALESVLSHLKSDKAEIEVEETKEKLILPKKALILLAEILKAMSQGKHISIIPIDEEVTTQQAAEILGCSRPHLVKLLEERQIPFIKIGRHRRVKYKDILKYKEAKKKEQERLLVEMMHLDEEQGLYDT